MSTKQVTAASLSSDLEGCIADLSEQELELVGGGGLSYLPRPPVYPFPPVCGPVYPFPPVCGPVVYPPRPICGPVPPPPCPPPMPKPPRWCY
jgi:hypothetical protein